jgi:hypothetical protein
MGTLEQRLVDDRRVAAGIEDALVDQHAGVVRVGQNLAQLLKRHRFGREAFCRPTAQS